MTIRPVTLYFWTAQALEAVLMRLTTDLKGCPACGAFPPAGHEEGCPVAAFNVAIAAAKQPLPSAKETARKLEDARRSFAKLRRRSSGRGGARPGAGRKSNRGGARPGAGRKPAKAAKRTPAKRTPAKKRPARKPLASPRLKRALKRTGNGTPPADTGSPSTPPA